MQKQAAMLPLELINLGAKPNIPLGLLHAELELLHPYIVVTINVPVQLLDSRVHGGKPMTSNGSSLMMDSQHLVLSARRSKS